MQLLSESLQSHVCFAGRESRDAVVLVRDLPKGDLGQSSRRQRQHMVAHMSGSLDDVVISHSTEQRTICLATTIFLL